MNRKDPVPDFSELYQYIYKRQLKNAFDELSGLIRQLPGQDIYHQMETLSDNYRNLLRYSFEGYKDPQQQSILNGIYTSLLALADEFSILRSEQRMPYHLKMKKMLEEAETDDPTPVFLNLKSFLSHTDDEVFRVVWLNHKLDEDMTHVIEQVIGSSKIPWHRKCLVVSALTLSLLSHFDIQKVNMLAAFVESHENQVYQRALTGLILALLVYDQRLIFYPELCSRISTLRSDESLAEEIELILLQLFSARETEKITREFENDVLPEMKKMLPKIEDKLQLEDPSGDEEMEGKNPEWKDIIGEVPGLIEKIEKYSRMQMEGGDVFMSTFRQLKRFEFFNRLSNWFVPFYRDHPELPSVFTENSELNDRLLGSLEVAFYICNSDKYSFALNFMAIPVQQRSMIVAHFEAEFAQMQELMSEEKLLDNSVGINAVYTQYIQDLYRFYKLFMYNQEFDDVFRKPILLPDLYFYRNFIERPRFTERIALFLFNQDHFNEAIMVYMYLTEKVGPRGDFFEKIGYCYQKTDQFTKAVEFYRKAELFDTNRLWLLKKLGWCNLKLKRYTEALSFFREAAELMPDDLTLQGQIAQCHLNLNDYEQALAVYSRIRFFDPGNVKLLRPVAYCLFILNRPTQAEEIYNELFGSASVLSAYDLMNAAHVQLCLGNHRHALELYSRSMNMKVPGRQALLEAFDQDAPHLVNNGIPASGIPLIRDYILFQSETP